MSNTDLDGLVNTLSGLSIIDVVKLVNMLEESWGVSASAQVVAAAPAAGAAAVAEKTEFDVHLKDAGAKKIDVIKEVRQITGLGLKEAKDLVDKGSTVIKEKVSKDDAAKMKAALEAAGATVEVK